MEHFMAAFGLLALLYMAGGALVPELAEARAARLRAWAAATTVSLRVIRFGWKQHWQIYRSVKEVESR
jgi:hypothetical protein